MLDCQEGLFSLLVNDRSESIILLLDLLHNFLLDALLLQYRRLHHRALRQRCVSLSQKLLELSDLIGTRLLQGHTTATATMIIEVAVIAERLVVDSAVSCE